MMRSINDNSLFESPKKSGNLLVKFNELAVMLLEHCAIIKGKELYIPRDIEFYFYSSKNMDIITYPRNSRGGEWFFHDSGVDISFESHVELKRDKKGLLKPYLTEAASFGGILIRSMDKVDDSFKIVRRILGPKNVMFELFDQFNALSTTTNFPILKYCDHKLGSAKLCGNGSRVNLMPSGKDAESKVASIIKYNYTGKDEDITFKKLVDNFNEFLNAPYHYTSLD